MITAVSQNRFHTPQKQAFGSRMPGGTSGTRQGNFVPETAKELEPSKRPRTWGELPFFNTNNLDLKIIASIMPLTMLATGVGMFISMSKVGDEKLQAKLRAEAYGKPAITDTLKLSKKVINTAKQLKK